MSTKLSFFEIPASNFERAVEFYRNVFNWKINIFGDENEMMGIFDLENISGAISFSNGFEPSKNGVLISVLVENIEDILKTTEENGGETNIPKTRIECEGKGYFAVFTDSEGNKIGLHSLK